MAAVDVAATTPVVVSGFKFKVNPVLGTVMVLVVVTATGAVAVVEVVPPPTLEPNPKDTAGTVEVVGAPSDRLAVVAVAEAAGAEELAMDANSEGPDRPRREFAAVVVGAVDVAVAPPSLAPKEIVGPWAGAMVGAEEAGAAPAADPNKPKPDPVA